MRELHHVKLTLHVLVLVVTEHVQLDLYLLLSLKHSDLVCSIQEVIKVGGAEGCQLVFPVTFLIFFLVGFLRHGFPFCFLVLVKHAVMIHKLKVLKVEGLCKFHTLCSAVHNPI